MKKTYFVILLAAVAVSCTKVEFEDPGQTDENTKVYLTLEGSVYSGIDTKVSIGDKENNVFPILWTKGDAIGLYSADGTSIQNVAARLDEASDGQKKGKFYVSDPISENGSTELYLYYPFNPLAIMAEGSTVIENNIASEQIQNGDSNSDHIGQNSFAFGKTSMTGAQDELVTFSMKHATAVVRIILATEELSDCVLKKVTLIDKDTETPIGLSGTANFDITSGVITPGLSPKPHVSVSLAETCTMGTSKELWLSTYPSDFTEKPLYVVITLERNDFNNDAPTTITIPIAKNGILKANAVNTIEISNLSVESNTVKWYEPVETRYMAGGWAYGEANTIFGLFGEGKDSDHIVSVKARGDFAKVQEPKYAVILFENHNAAGKEITMLNGQTKKGTFVEVSEDYTITLKANYLTGDHNNSAGCGKIGIYAADQINCLWALNFWVGEQFHTQTYKCGAEVMDRNIGSRSSSWADWKNGGAYFQWGRPYAFGWSNKILEGERITELKQASGFDFEYTVSHPNQMFSPSINENKILFYDWYTGPMNGDLSDRKNDLWGNPDNNHSGGHKSIYDPCPKGYRVISPDVLEEIRNAGVDKSNEKLYTVRYETGDGMTAYWPLAGAWLVYKYGNNNNNTMRTANNNTSYALYWSNSPLTGTHYADHLNIMGIGNSANKEIGNTDPAKKAPSDEEIKDIAGGRANAYPVRCMVDKENR